MQKMEIVTEDGNGNSHRYGNRSKIKQFSITRYFVWCCFCSGNYGQTWCHPQNRKYATYSNAILRRNEPQPWLTRIDNLVKSGYVLQFLRYAYGQTYTLIVFQKPMPQRWAASYKQQKYTGSNAILIATFNTVLSLWQSVHILCILQLIPGQNQYMVSAYWRQNHQFKSLHDGNNDLTLQVKQQLPLNSACNCYIYEPSTVVMCVVLPLHD